MVNDSRMFKSCNSAIYIVYHSIINIAKVINSSLISNLVSEPKMANTESGNQSNPSEFNTAPITHTAASQNSLVGMNITHSPSVKLDRNNFLLWKNMIMPIIKGHNLDGYLLRTNECPPEFSAT